MLKLHFILEFN